MNPDTYIPTQKERTKDMRKFIGATLLWVCAFSILGTAGSSDLDRITLAQAAMQLVGAGLIGLIGWILYSKTI